MFLGFEPRELLKELFQGNLRIDHDGPHLREVLEVRIEIDCIEDAESLLADFGALPRGPPKHLLVEDAAVHPAQEHQVGDARHVDAGGEQTHAATRAERPPSSGLCNRTYLGRSV